MKIAISFSLSLTLVLVILDLERNAGMWDLPEVLVRNRKKDESKIFSFVVGILKRFVQPNRLKFMPWDEIAANLAFQVRAGKTLVQAIDSVSREGSSLAHKKLSTACRFYESGMPIFKALETVSDGDGALFMLASVLEIGAISGGDTASLLWHVFEILKRRRIFRGEVAAKLTEAKITSYILICLPWIMGFTIFKHNTGLFQSFIKSANGKTLFMAAVALWIIGMFSIISVLRSASPSTVVLGIHGAPKLNKRGGGKVAR